jgi:hypothetical protein
MIVDCKKASVSKELISKFEFLIPPYKPKIAIKSIKYFKSDFLNHIFVNLYLINHKNIMFEINGPRKPTSIDEEANSKNRKTNQNFRFLSDNILNPNTFGITIATR